MCPSVPPRPQSASFLDLPFVKPDTIADTVWWLEPAPLPPTEGEAYQLGLSYAMAMIVALKADRFFPCRLGSVFQDLFESRRKSSRADTHYLIRLALADGFLAGVEMALVAS